MGFTIKTKLKAELLEKSKSAKKHFEQEASLAALVDGADSELLPAMKLEKRAIASLKGLKKRVRKSEAAQVERVCRSIKKLKQSVPILINAAGEIINGHIVAEALRRLDAREAWCAVVDHLDENECNLLHVTLNRIAECGDWDLGQLQPLLVEFEELGVELETTGFSLQELDIIMNEDPAASPKPKAEKSIDLPEMPVSQLGDLWVLDHHRLLCGDATDPDSYASVMSGQHADCVSTDCPWNIKIEGFVSGLGEKKHKDFVMGAGEMSDNEFLEFSKSFHKLASDHLKEGGAFFSFIDWRSIDVIMEGGKVAGLRHINTVVWNKGSGGMGAPYRSAHELVAVFCKGKQLAVNNVALGKHGRDRTNVWSYPGANNPGSSAGKALAHHPTPKPVEMIRDALLDVTKREAVVLDPFMGSGTTILAAQQCGRYARGIELDPRYVDVAIRRWQEMTGKQAVHQASGLTFAELAEQRFAEASAQLAA